MKSLNDDKGLPEALIKKGRELGASDVILFLGKDVVYDLRTYLKCLFGCGEGQPFCPTTRDHKLVETWKDILSHYQWGVFIRTNDEKKGQDIALSLEKMAFYAGSPFAFACTGCAQCEECNFVKGKDCCYPELVRLRLCAAGIDVFSTLRNIGWKLEILQKMDDKPSYISAVFVN